MHQALRWKPLLSQHGLNQESVKAYFKLGKPRLTALVLGTTMAGYSLGTTSIDLPVLGMTLLGTAFSSTSAHAFNQWGEYPYDAQMMRTRQRPIPAAILFPPQAALFGIGTGIAGVGILAAFCNFSSAALALSTILLYSSVYTPMKRISIRNTWIGSLVGAIPPLIGYAASGASILSPEAFTLPGLLFAWQFPHFCALSWNLKSDYAFGGYQMMSVQNPAKNTRTALLYSLVLPGICIGCTLIGQCTFYFLISSSIVNAPLILASFMFNNQASRKSAKRLFFLSLLHLPLLMGFMLYHRQKQENTVSKKI